MNLTAIHELDRDEHFRTRVRTAAKLEGVENAEAWALNNTFEIAKQEPFYTKYAEGLNITGAMPGRDTKYITDEMIIAAVQALINPEPNEA